MSSQSPGVLQRMSELEVSRIVWGLAGDGLRPLYDALGSARMTQPLASGFERGYQRHEYEQNADGSGYQDIVMTRDPAPMVADFLDALNCSGFSRSRLREVIEPDRRYPYPVDAPLCR